MRSILSGCVAMGIAILLTGCGGGTPGVTPIAGPAKVNDDHPAKPGPNDWPWWRGTARRNHATGDAPLTWSETEHVVWKALLPGRGHASPIVWGERVFIATAEGDDDAITQSLLCFDRATGVKLWTTEVHRGAPIPMHEKNSHASATPAADGERVFTAFAIDNALFVTAIDYHGKIVWQKRVADFESRHGFGASPLIYRSMLIVNGDNHGPGFLTALDRETGEMVWKTPRPDKPSYGTPVVLDVAGRKQLLLHGGKFTQSYTPDTGERLWYCKGPADVTGNSIEADDLHVYSSGGNEHPILLCIRADSSGDVTDSHIVWESRRSASCVPSPLVHDGRVYVATDSGTAYCLDPSNGEAIWRQRVRGGVSASPVLVGDRIYLATERGVTYVFKAGDTCSVLAENTLPGEIMATPAIAGDRIYLRTSEALYCIGAHETAAASD